MVKGWIVSKAYPPNLIHDFIRASGQTICLFESEADAKAAIIREIGEFNEYTVSDDWREWQKITTVGASPLVYTIHLCW